MTYIEPNSTVKLIKNCPLDNKYEHTLYFGSASEQESYFLGLTGSTLNSQMYVRAGNGIFRCSLPMADTYNVNYMMFKNNSFENFWFYAFVTNVEYVNNGLCEVHFELDVMQTWFIQKLELKECYVEREHVASDNIGEHIEPESISTGEYVVNYYGELAKGDHDTYDNMKQYAVIVAVCDSDKDSSASGKLYDGVYGGATLFAYRQGDKAGINAKINEYVNANKADAIIAIYMTPQYFVEWYLDDESHKVGESTEGRTITYTLTKLSTNDTMDGYKPKNKKLYTYPYNFMQIDNSNGNGMILRYEFFKDMIPKVRVSGTIVPPISLMCRPKYYKNDSVDVLCTETLTVSSFPVCSWNYDAYQAWCAQAGMQAQRLVSNTLQGAFSGGISGGAVGAAGGAITSAVGTGLDILAKDYQASHSADTMNGNFNSGNANFSVGEHGFNVGRFSITKEYARRIDDFFSMFGYNVGRVKIPNINKRPHWSYVKTANCKVRGSAPADAIKQVEQIFDKGITFWKNASEFCNYDLDNSI